METKPLKELIFAFKNIATNTLLNFIDNRRNAKDFVEFKKEGEYPSFFSFNINHYKSSLPDFENEILQIINTTNQATIDTYFTELYQNIEYIEYKILPDTIEAAIKKWNEETLRAFNEKVERQSDEYFKNEDRKRKHLEEYEDWDFRSALFFGVQSPAQKVKRINYNYYCVEEQPDLIDETYCKEYQVFLADLAGDYFTTVLDYVKAYDKGEIVSQVEKIIFNKPVVFVEGEHDITYITQAARLLNKRELIAKVELRQRGGYSNLDKLWEIYKSNNWETVPQKKLLLYDCDTKKIDEQTVDVYKRVIKTVPQNTITKGIENLFPTELIEKAMSEKPAFVDITKIDRVKRGVKSLEISYEVNSDEKKNLCVWICKYATADDFKEFQNIFDLIETIV